MIVDEINTNRRNPNLTAIISFPLNQTEEKMKETEVNHFIQLFIDIHHFFDYNKIRKEAI